MKNHATKGAPTKARNIAAVLSFMMVLGFSGVPHAFAMNFTLDQWGGNTPQLHYLWANQIATTNPNFIVGTEYAGVFSGYDTATSTRYYVECVELNHNISLGGNYTVNVFTNFLASPIQNGNPPDSGSLISEAQKRVVRGAFMYLGLGRCLLNGLMVEGAQDLAGTTNSSVLLGLSNEQAAALQLTLWEVVHEPWLGRNGISLDSGDLIWRQSDNSPFNAEFYQLFNTMVDAAFIADAVPEPSTFILLGMGLGGLAILRKRARKQ